jgi:hypothetical protein
VEAEAAVEAEVQVEAAEVEAAGEVAEAEEAPPEPARERSRRLPQGRSGMRPGVSPGNMSRSLARVRFGIELVVTRE